MVLMVLEVILVVLGVVLVVLVVVLVVLVAGLCLCLSVSVSVCVHEVLFPGGCRDLLYRSLNNRGSIESVLLASTAPRDTPQ